MKCFRKLTLNSIQAYLQVILSYNNLFCFHKCPSSCMLQVLYEAQMMVLNPEWVPPLPDKIGASSSSQNEPSEAHAEGDRSPSNDSNAWMWDQDLVIEDLLEEYMGMDRATIRVDRKAGPEADKNMSYLEKEASTLIYDGADTSRLDATFTFLKIQARHKLSNVCMDDIFQAIHSKVIAKSANSRMPQSRAEARKIISEVGLDYVTIDACPCDKFLYYGEENVSLKACPKCHTSRFSNAYQKTDVPRKVNSLYTSLSILQHRNMGR